ncbi:hypothetical protein ETU08_01710 [Apibacter muscae]|uniref:hypothetical protein n=1 Tax=Apibacter muscae TaxID=2509004 RepID=UPI0011AC9BB1|nr:hypothetical protein [Apibacter muscae]TWP31221.1 hypothetical protein ETU08_01710 [Apibacter muscae]
MWYNPNLKKLAVLTMPPGLRNNFSISYLISLLKPLETTLYNWQKLRNNSLYKLQHTGQVCYLRKVLNDRFDPIQRRIIITGSQRYKSQYIYTEAEKKEKYLGTMYLRRDVDFEDNGADFLVLAPAELLDENNYEMNALIDYYKLASKRYRIEPLEYL